MSYWSIFPFQMRFTNLHGVTWSSPLTKYALRRWRVRYLIMISQQSLFGAIQLDPHFWHLVVAKLIIPETFHRCLGFDLGHGDRTFDDGWFHVTQFSTYRTSNDILGHISVLIEIYKSPWSCMLISTYEVHTEMMTYLLSYHDPLVEPLWSHPIRFIFFRRLGCCHVSPSGLWIWMTRFVLLMIDDLRPFVFFYPSHIWFHIGTYFLFGWDL